MITTQDGLAESTDGGAAFTLLEDAPTVLLVSWAYDGTYGRGHP